MIWSAPWSRICLPCERAWKFEGAFRGVKIKVSNREIDLEVTLHTLHHFCIQMHHYWHFLALQLSTNVHRPHLSLQLEYLNLSEVREWPESTSTCEYCVRTKSQDTEKVLSNLVSSHNVDMLQDCYWSCICPGRELLHFTPQAVWTKATCLWTIMSKMTNWVCWGSNIPADWAICRDTIMKNTGWMCNWVLYRILQPEYDCFQALLIELRCEAALQVPWEAFLTTTNFASEKMAVACLIHIQIPE